VSAKKMSSERTEASKAGVGGWKTALIMDGLNVVGVVAMAAVGMSISGVMGMAVVGSVVIALVIAARADVLE
jgi:hypothetical protein